MISMDEIGPWHTGTVPDETDPDHATLRREVLWGSILGGAAGVEWYFGAKFPHNDLTSEDWRQREAMWKQTKHALDFFTKHTQYWKMRPSECLRSEHGHCFASPGEMYVAFIPGSVGDAIRMDLSACDRDMTIQWYNPRSGGPLQSGTIESTKPTANADLGRPPNEHDKDWVVLVK